MLQVKRPELLKRLKKREDERKVRATDQKQLQQDLFGDDDELQDLEDEEQRRWVPGRQKQQQQQQWLTSAGVAGLHGTASEHI